MMRSLAAILSLAVLILAARNARLADRERILEEKLALAEARQKPPRRQAPAPERATPLETPIAVSRGAAPVDPAFPAAQGGAGPAQDDPRAQNRAPAQSSVVQLVKDAHQLAMFAFRDGSLSLSLPGNEDQLGLTASQKHAIDELRKLRDVRTHAYREELATIESQTEASIRQLLDPEQLAKYDHPGNATVQVQWSAPQVEPPLPAGVSPGYLGVSGEDVNGGGVRLGAVLENTVASAAGLKPGDIILAVNGELVPNYAALAAKVRSSGEGSPALLRIQRGGSEFTQGLQLGGRPQ